MVFRLRQYKNGDEEGMIACIREEYGATYFKHDFYRPEFYRKETETGHITFLVAESQTGEIAGMMILKEFYPEESMCEIATQIFRKKYRGYGLAIPFFEFGMSILVSRSYSAAYCLPVLFHDITQRLLYRLKMHATEFFLNVFDLEKIQHSYGESRNEKHGQGIQVMAIEKQAVGTLYVLEEHREFTSDIYEKLGVHYQIDTQKKEEQLPEQSYLKCRFDMVQSSLEICVVSYGKDVMEQINCLEKNYPNKGRQTCNILLNINAPYAIIVYQILHKRGYFFTGFKSLCSEREYMVLHHPGEIKIYFEEYALSEEFALIAAYVKKQYMEQYCVGEYSGDEKTKNKD